jgi:NAD(P)-dependent dehydrogenase (short-subunit alcohol dehydrogenase family)
VTRALIVTGGSRGIGAACAALAAQRGWSVCVNYRSNEAAATDVVRSIENRGGKAIAIAGDVSCERDVVSMFDQAEDAFGSLAGLVNNAGILAPAARLADIALDRWTATIATNLTGTFLCAREAVRRMATSRGGRGGAIVNVSSMAAVLGGAGEFTDYAASKGAVDTLTIGLAKEVAADGIRVNGVRPGLIDTEIHASGGDTGRVARLLSTVPMQRIGTIEEVANAVLWLLSDEASYCTGVTLNVSGGR